MIKFKIKDDRINYLIQAMIVMSLPISMISGLFAGVWIAIWTLILCLQLGLNLKEISSKISLVDHVIILFCIFSIFWSMVFLESILNASKILLIIMITKVIYSNIGSLKIKKDAFIKALVLSYVAAIIIFIIEIYSRGFISLGFREIFQSCKEHKFYDHWLDRGICIFAVTSWALIYHFWNSKKPHLGLVTYFVTLLIIFLSDSDSSRLAYLCSGILALFLRISNMKLYRLFVSMMVCGIFLMPIFSYYQPLEQMPHAPGKIAISHLHRLYIWKFVSVKSMDRPALGHGLGASRHIHPEERFYGHVMDENGRSISLNPLPLHPHNNILQVLLELGICGLLLFAFYIRHLLYKIRSIGEKNMLLSICISGAFLTYFIIGMISYNMLQSWWVMVIILSTTLMGLVKKA